MPTYEYECTQCGRIFELFQSITAKAVKRMECECRDCDNLAPVIRLIGAGSGVLFKGSGFYQTDYRSEGYKKAAKAEADSGKSESKDGSKKSGDKSDSVKKSAESGSGASGSASPKTPKDKT